MRGNFCPFRQGVVELGREEEEEGEGDRGRLCTGFCF